MKMTHNHEHKKTTDENLKENIENQIEENNPWDEALSDEQFDSIDNQENIIEAENNELEKLTAENKKLREVAANIQNQYLSLQSDFKILQTKYQRDVVEWKNQAIAKSSKILLSSIDELEKIISQAGENPRKSWLEMVVRSMEKKLENIWVKKINVWVWDEMNENIHEPLGSIPAGENLSGKIAQVYSNAYSIWEGENQTIIQAAKVMIWN